MDEGEVIPGEVCTQLMLAVPTGWAGWGWWRQIATPRYTSHITHHTRHRPASGPGLHTSAVKRSIGFTNGFHNHGEGPY